MLSHVRLLVTPRTVAHQAPLYTGFSRQEYWSGLPFPPQGDLPHRGTKPTSLMSPALASRLFPTEPPGTPWTPWQRARLSIIISNQGLQMVRHSVGHTGIIQHGEGHWINHLLFWTQAVQLITEMRVFQKHRKAWSAAAAVTYGELTHCILNTSQVSSHVILTPVHIIAQILHLRNMRLRDIKQLARCHKLTNGMTRTRVQACMTPQHRLSPCIAVLCHSYGTIPFDPIFYSLWPTAEGP